MRGLIVACVIVGFGVAGCKKGDETKAVTAAPTSSQAGGMMESAVNEAGSNASALDGSSISPMEYDPFAACSYSGAQSGCASQSRTVNWSGCNLGTATLTGLVTETFTGSGANSCALTASDSMVKRVISTSNPRKITFASGAFLSSDMEPGTAFDGTTFSDISQGTTIQRIESGTSNNLTCGATGTNVCYNLVIRGLHNGYTTAGGVKLTEHIITANVTYQGSKLNSNRLMSGTMTVWRQVLGAKAVNVFNNVKWGSSSCCYPTEGTIVSTITGAVAGSATMTFNTSCTLPTVSINGGNAENYELSQCTP